MKQPEILGQFNPMFFSDVLQSLLLQCGAKYWNEWVLTKRALAVFMPVTGLWERKLWLSLTCFCGTVACIINRVIDTICNYWNRLLFGCIERQMIKWINPSKQRMCQTNMAPFNSGHSFMMYCAFNYFKITEHCEIWVWCFDCWIHLKVC